MQNQKKMDCYKETIFSFSANAPTDSTLLFSKNHDIPLILASLARFFFVFESNRALKSSFSLNSSF